MTLAQFPVQLSSAHAARGFVRREVAGFSESMVEATLLLVSELVTNAVLHARSSVSVEVKHLRRGVRVEVTDMSPLPPVLLPRSDTAGGGRGMALVDAVSTRWGVTAIPNGKTVWFEVDSA